MGGASPRDGTPWPVRGHRGLIVREGALASLLSATSVIPLGPAAALALAARVWATVGEMTAFGIALAVELIGRRAERWR